MSEAPSGADLTLTIVVANYNHGRFLPRCLDAIVAQTRQPIEVLVIDDASTDHSVSVIEEFAPRLTGFRFIRRRQNRGVVATMNEGLKEARGTHVLFAAADDWIEPDLVEQTMDLLSRFPSAGLCSALTRLADEAGTIIGPFRTQLPLREPGYILPELVPSLLCDDDGWFNGNTTIVNRAAALEAGGYRPELKSFTDMFLNVTLAQRYGACFIPRFLAVWRRMDEGYAASLLVNSEAMLETFVAAERLMRAPGWAIVASDYVNRWASRWRFTAARSMLEIRAAGGNATLAPFLPDGLRWAAGPIEAVGSIPKIGLSIGSGLLFLLLRTRDIGPVLRRRMDWLFLDRRLEYTSR